MSFNQTSNLANNIDYKLLAGPYYNIFINGSKTSLPEWLAKQVKSIEITEAEAAAEESVDLAVITFIDAYENVTDQSDARFNANIITSKPGNLLDLVIDNQNQIRILTQADLDARKMAYLQTQKTVTKTVTGVTFNTVISAENTANGQVYTLLNALTIQLDSNSRVVNGFQQQANFASGGTVQQQLADNQILVTGLPPLAVNSSISQDITIQYSAPVVQPVTQPVNPKAPKFLLQEGNTVDIEWGYKTGPNLKRKMRFIIQYVEYDAPESSSPEVKVYCTPQIRADLAKLHPTKGLTFKTPVKTASGNTQNIDMQAGDIVKTIAQSCGYAFVISKSTGRINASDIKSFEKTKTITPDDSIYSYLHKLARSIGFHFFVAYSFKTGKDTIFFISDEDYSKYSVFNFIWKGPNTILTSYSVKSDFSRLQEGTTVSVDSQQNTMTIAEPSQAKLTFDMRNPTDLTKQQISTQTTVTVQTGLNNVFKDGVTGVSLYSPVNQDNANKVVLDQHLQSKENAIILNGTMLGHPFVCPCVATFSNIGKRYSGRYRLMMVKHMMDSSGYRLQFTASTNVVADSLVDTEKEAGDKDPQPVNYIINLKAANPVSTINTAPTDTSSTANNFNSTFELPGKVNQTNSLGSNNGAQ